MSTAGEAASLFGAADLASDPFSSALNDNASPSDNSTSNVQPLNAVSDLFGSSEDTFLSDVDAASSSAPQTDTQSWYNSPGQETHVYDTAGSGGYAPAYQNRASYAQTNGTYSLYGLHSESAASNQPTASSTSAYEPPYTGQTHNYAPQSHESHSQNSSAYFQQPPVTQHGTYSALSSYDPYKPLQTHPSHEPSSCATITTPPTPSPYDPYKPSYHTPASPSTHTHTYGLDTQTPAYANPPVVVPPPAPLVSAPPPPLPAVSVSHYRPKTSNAYDPPLPPPKRHVSVPPRPVYTTPPSVTPPPRTTLTPQSIPPPPRGARRTPDSHAFPAPARRDSQASALKVVPPQPSPGPYPSVVNGTHVNAAYHSPPSPSANYDHVANDSYHKVGPAADIQPAEGLPKVNDTYAPPSSTYAPPMPRQGNSFDDFNVTSQSVPVMGYGSPVSDDTFRRAASPLRNEISDWEEETPRGELHEISPRTSPPKPKSSASSAMLSPPTSADLHATAESAWPSYEQPPPPPGRGPSSPDRVTSLPRPADVTPPSLASRAPATTYDCYAPPLKSSASDRARSPSTASIHSVAAAPRQSQEQPQRKDSTSFSSPLSRPMSSQSRRSTLSSSYEPSTIPEAKRTTSPTGSVRSTASKTGAYDPYVPAVSSTVHGRTTSNGSAYSTTSSDPYAPPVRPHPGRLSSEFAFGSFSMSSLPPAAAYAPSAPAGHERPSAQVVTIAGPAHSAYAPSPSLLGTNDPLGRTSARVPVISFGFGGKLVTCFHGANMHTGFDVALSARQSTDVKIQLLHKVIPESALETSAASYPGPLYSDPGSPTTTSLVRTGAQALKTKKAHVIKYLEERAEEMMRGLGYHHPGTMDRSHAEAKRVLVMLLKVMVENDGRLSGSTQIDSAVREVLSPHLGASPSDSTMVAAGMIPTISTEHLSASYSAIGSVLANTQEQTVVTIAVRSSQLDKIQDFLARGDRRGACHYAADQKLWPHALLIASGIDKECWKEVVTEWIRAELIANGTQEHGNVLNGRESLRVAYSLFSGNGSTAVQELVHPSLLLHHGQNTLQVLQQPSSVTPMTPNFPVITPLNISQEVLASWAKTTAMILSNPMTPESSAALSALGDQLSVHQWNVAAHICYLLSPQTSALGSLGSNPKLVLLGSPPPQTSPIFFKDPDSIIFSEIAEFAMSLATPTKGQEPFGGLPHLQPFRLIRAAHLAELGHVQLASRYCEAITVSISRGPVVNITLIEQLKTLSDRLIAAPHMDRSGSWIGGKMSKPSFDGLGNWLEGRFTKFIAGEGDPRPEESGIMEQQQSRNGPFANYSSISSTTTSTHPSPRQSVTDLTDIPSGFAPPYHSGLARPPSRSNAQINRASSAMDHVRPFQRTGSPIARVASANAATFADAASYGQARSPYGNGYTPVPAHAYDYDHLSPDSSSHGDVSGLGHARPSSSSSWWGASESDASTPTASTFVQPGDHSSSSTSNSGFISLMDDPMLSTPTITKTQSSPLPHPSHYDDDDDDLGLGNTAFKKADKPESEVKPTTESSKEEEKPKLPAADRPEAKHASSSGWLSRIWGGKRGESPAPIKANLGEQSSFFYDKELKRWVNKKVGADGTKPSPPPPPPPRAQTASPGRQFGAVALPSPLGPPPRPATAQAIDLSSEPPRRPPTRLRSNLVPSEIEGGPSAPPSPMPQLGTSFTGDGPPPPAGKARGGAAKRNLRTRYVDVFQQEGVNPT